MYRDLLEYYFSNQGRRLRLRAVPNCLRHRRRHLPPPQPQPLHEQVLSMNMFPVKYMLAVLVQKCLATRRI
jgi:hypothetical protein